MRLPAFFALRALEAAARHRSYSRAASELAVTHGAVSQQIRKLEAELGAKLFERHGNSMVPTPAADRLAGEVGRALGIMGEAVSVFAGSGENDPLVVSLDPQFAGRWLPSRLNRLIADPAGADLDFRVEERMANFLTDGMDMGVRYGPGHYPGLESAKLFQEKLFPVCSPAFAATRRLVTPDDLLKAPLLHHRHRPWDLWFAPHGLQAPPAKGLVFEDSILLLEAAVQGLGLALARSTLTEQDIKTGRLVTPVASTVPSDRALHVVWRPESRKLRRIHALRDWLLAETAPARA